MTIFSEQLLNIISFVDTMYAEYLNNPELSDVTLVLSDDVSVHAHMFVLYAHAKDYFRTASRYTGEKRKTPDEPECDPNKTFSIVGWKDDLRAAADFVEFMYRGFDCMGHDGNAWSEKFFDEADMERVCALMCTADAYGAKRIVSCCMTAFVKSVDLTKLDWKEFFQLPPSIQEDAAMLDAIWKPLSTGVEFQKAYMQLAIAEWPTKQICDVLNSDKLELWSEDVVLEFLLVSHENGHPFLTEAKEVLDCLRVGQLSLKGLNVLLRCPLATAMTKKNRGLAQNMACLWRDNKKMPNKWNTPRCELSAERRKTMFSFRVDGHTLLALPKGDKFKETKEVPSAIPIHIPFVTCEIRYWYDTYELMIGLSSRSTTPYMEFAGQLDVRYLGELGISRKCLFDDEKCLMFKKSIPKKFIEKPGVHLRIALCKS